MKKVISIALALLMVAVMLPVMAMADEATLQSQINNATSGATITLGKNYTEDITIPAGKAITLDLATFTLTGSSSHTITNNGTLTVVGTTGKVVNNVVSKGALFNNVGAIANLNGGTFEGNTWYVIKNLGTITMNGASVTQNDAGSSAIDNGWYDSTSTSGHGNDCGIVYPGNGYARLTIANGNFNGGMNTVKNDDYGVLQISGGTFSNTNGPTVLNWNVATISGGKFTVNNGASSVIANGSYNNEADKGQLTITGGEFNSAGGHGALFGYGDGAQHGGNLSITGGFFNGLIPQGDYPYLIAITGGKFEDIDGAKEYLATGKELDGNGNVVNKPGAPIIIYTPTEDTSKADNQKNPSTGANDFVSVAAAMAVVSLLGAAAVIRKK